MSLLTTRPTVPLCPDHQDSGQSVNISGFDWFVYCVAARANNDVEGWQTRLNNNIIQYCYYTMKCKYIYLTQLYFSGEQL